MQGLVLVKSSGHCFELAHLVSAFQNVCPMVNRNVLAFSKNGWAWPNAAMELLSRIVRKYGTVRHNWQRRVRILMYRPASRGIGPGMPPASQSTGDKDCQAQHKFRTLSRVLSLETAKRGTGPDIRTRPRDVVLPASAASHRGLKCLMHSYTREVQKI